MSDNAYDSDIATVSGNNGHQNKDKLDGATEPHHGQNKMPVIFRSAEDIKLLRQKDGVIVILSIALVVVTGLAFFLFLRKPDLIVAVTTPDGQRVVQLGNRNFEIAEPVQLGKEKLSNDDKTYLVNLASQLRYGVDKASREKDMEKWLRLFIPKSAVFYANQLKEKGVLVMESSEQWQAVWKPQSIKVDSSNPYLVRIIGQQTINKVINGAGVVETVQLELLYKLTTNGVRSDDNMRTGFQIVQFDEQVISRQSQPAVN